MQPSTDERLAFDQADRLRRALRISGIGVEEMAKHLEVSPNTVSNWINGRNAPRDRDLRQFALRTGFPITWLRDGLEASAGGGDDGTPGPGGIGTTPRKITFRLPAAASNVRHLRAPERELLPAAA